MEELGEDPRGRGGGAAGGALGGEVLPRGPLSVVSTLATGVVALGTQALVWAGDAGDRLLFTTPLGASPSCEAMSRARRRSAVGVASMYSPHSQMLSSGVDVTPRHAQSQARLHVTQSVEDADHQAVWCGRYVERLQINTPHWSPRPRPSRSPWLLRPLRPLPPQTPSQLCAAPRLAGLPPRRLAVRATSLQEQVAAARAWNVGRLGSVRATISRAIAAAAPGAALGLAATDESDEATSDDDLGGAGVASAAEPRQHVGVAAPGAGGQAGATSRASSTDTHRVDQNSPAAAEAAADPAQKLHSRESSSSGVAGEPRAAATTWNARAGRHIPGHIAIQLGCIWPHVRCGARIWKSRSVRRRRTRRVEAHMRRLGPHWRPLKSAPLIQLDPSGLCSALQAGRRPRHGRDAADRVGQLRC